MGYGAVRPPTDVRGLARMLHERPMPWDGSVDLDYLGPALAARADGSTPELDGFLSLLAAGCGDGSGSMHPDLASAPPHGWSSLNVLLAFRGACRSPNAGAAGEALAASLAGGCPPDPAARSRAWSVADALGRKPAMPELLSGGLAGMFAAAPWPTARAVAGIERASGTTLEAALPGIDPSLAAGARARQARIEERCKGLEGADAPGESC